MELVRPTLSMATAISHLHAACFPQPWSEGDFQTFLGDKDVFGVAIKHNNVLIGCILLRQAGEEAEILTIAVAPHHRRCGVARKLMEAGHHEALQRRIHRISLEVACDNAAAHALYTSLSYQQVGLRKAYYRRENGTTQDARVMVCSLAAHPPSGLAL